MNDPVVAAGREHRACPTRELTLHRLTVAVEATAEGMRSALEEQCAHEEDLRIEQASIDGRAAVVVHGQRRGLQEPEWLRDARRSTRIELDVRKLSPAVVVFIAVDGRVYAWSYGDGHYLIPDTLKDPTFGRRLASRACDPEEITGVHRRPADTPGRRDSTVSTAGLRWRDFGLRPHLDRVDRISARGQIQELTYSRCTGRRPRIHCSTGVATKFGIEPADLVADIRLLAEIEQEKQPHEAFADFNAFQEVDDPDELGLLNLLLDDALGGRGELELAIAPTQQMLDDQENARSVQAHIGGVAGPVREELDIGEIRSRLRVQRRGARVQALRDAKLTFYKDRSGREKLRSYTNLLRCIDALLPDGDRIYTLTDGHWFELGANYAESLRNTVQRLIDNGGHLRLPDWADGLDERDYVEDVARDIPGMIALDRKLAGTPLHNGNGVELCDLLGEHDELIHVKQADSAGALSHLFIQAQAAVEALDNEAEARSWLRDRIRATSPERDLGDGWRPRTVVLAIRLKTHRPLSAQSLFPTSQVALAALAEDLHRRGMELQVTGIPSYRS
ncbi:TIGR04141 family sporadically distributed protein [Streptomonospora sediminis]